jgi:hypothetical protein
MKLPAIFKWFLIALAGLDLYLLSYGQVCRLRLNFWKPRPAARILFLADPQMEGHTAVYRRGRVGQLNNDLNDAFFAHLWRNLLPSAPTHAVFLGDIFSYQHLDNDEFAARLRRFEAAFPPVDGTARIVIPGNHDVGYGFELHPDTLRRFERAFGGAANRIVRAAGHDLVILNAMNLDSPSPYESGADARRTSMRQDTLATLHDALELEQDKSDDDDAAGADAHNGGGDRHGKDNGSGRGSGSGGGGGGGGGEDHGHPKIVITHIPLHKEGDTHRCNGDTAEIVRTSGGYVREQTMLSPETTAKIVDGLKPALVFTGHDHEGCIHRHSDRTLELTVRSCMGDYGGHAVFLDIFNEMTTAANDQSDGSTSGGGGDDGEVKFRYVLTECAFVQMKFLIGVLITNAVVAFGSILWLMIGYRCTGWGAHRASAKIRVQ